MKRLKTIYLILLIITVIIITGVCLTYNYMLSPTGKSKDIIEVEIPKGTPSRGIATILKNNDLIRNERFFIIYLRIFNYNDLKAGHYEFSKSMGVKNLVNELREGSKKNPDEISLTIREGIHMRDIAKLISKHTNNSYDEVIAKANDGEYINKLKEKYWFITDELDNKDLYYKLEGYLFPETYRLTNKNVSVEYIFNKALDQMGRVLEPMRKDIEDSRFSVHEFLSFVAVVEKESSRKADRGKIASVFMNRLNKNMPLGSDPTTRYACKIDNKNQVLSKANFAMRSLYNTRLTDGLMNGKVPVGPISTVSKMSMEASLYPPLTDYLFFIANIQTLETFFYVSYNDFLKKKDELREINGGF